MSGDVKETKEEEVVEGEQEVVEEGETSTETSETQGSEVKQFFDPNEVPAELKGAWNKMQGAFTRAMQGVSSEREKAQLYDKLASGDVESVVQSLAAKAGLKVTKEGDVVKTNGAKADDSPTTRYIRDIIKEELAPLVTGFKETQAKMATETLISNLKTNYPDWYVYENEMATLLETHPTLRFEPARLYRLAKAEAEEVAVTQQSGEKREKVATKPSSGRESRVVNKRAETLDEAIALAKRQHNIKE